MTTSRRLLDPSAFAAPRVGGRYVPWALAVRAVGEYLHKEEWEGAELALSQYTPLDRKAEIDAKVRQQFPPNSIPISKISPDFAAKREAERRALADAISKEMPALTDLVIRNDGRKRRLLEAQTALFDAILNSDIAAHWYAVGSTIEPKRVPGGELIRAWDAERDNLRSRGVICRDRATRYVYVDAAQLAERFPLNPLRETTVGSIPLDRLSPYLQLMIEVSLLEEVTAATRTTPETLGQRLMDEAPKFGLTVGQGNDGSDITKTWATALAKALRWPDARKGHAEPGSTRKR